MKRISYLFALVILVAASYSQASATVVDTVYADSIYMNGILGGVSSPLSAFGKPDSQYANLDLKGGLPTFDVVFYRHNGKVVTKNVLPIKANATLRIWGKKDTQVDSSAGAVMLMRFDGAGNLQQSEPYILENGITTISVPNQDYEYLEFILAGNGQGISFAKSFYLDAVGLLEDTSQPSGVANAIGRVPIVGILGNYPNPFSNATNVRFSVPMGGNASLVAVDMQGVEHSRAELGYLSEGEHRVAFDLRDHGMYFLRLFVNGVPVGNPIKVVSQ